MARDISRMQIRQSGLVVVMFVLVLVLLLGVAALALDLGRLYVLKSEMQNAADAAALAGAAELDADDDAMERAELAAKELLIHNSHFANIKSLLGSDVDIDFRFYCSIGGSQDEGAVCDGGTTDEDEPGKIIVDTQDELARYIRVTLNPDKAGNEEHYGIDLYFLPVLSVLGIDAARHAVTRATALAGRHFYFCNYPPLMICDPFEGSGGLKNSMNAGEQIVLKNQGGGSTWGTGMFGFLYPRDPETLDFITTNNTLAEYLADENRMGCTPPIVKARGGNIAPLTDAWNMRFDIEASFPVLRGEYETYPPDINISEHGGYYIDEDGQIACPPANYCLDDENRRDPVCWRDTALRCIDDDESPYLGGGDWDALGYWIAKYGDPSDPVGDQSLPPTLELLKTEREANGLTLTRHDVYEYEIDEDNGVDYEKPAEASHRDVALAGRRLIHIAVLSCETLGIGPNDTIRIDQPDGFAKFFMTERSVGSPQNDFFAEYIGWAEEDEANYHVTVQLYE